MENNRELFGQLFDLTRNYTDCLRQRLGGAHVHPGQGPILGLLLSMDNTSQADLVRRMGVSAATVAVSVARLERLGFVQRERNARDQRANILRLTEAGRAEALRMQSAMNAVCDGALEGFTAEERRLLEGFSLRVASNLHRMSGRG